MPDFGKMAGDALGLGVTYKTPNGVIGGIWIDCTVRERHGMSAEVSEHPVEDGADIADHIRRRPNALTLECVISNTPVIAPESHADGAAEITVKVPVPPAPVKLPFGLGDAAVRVGPFGELAIKEGRDATVKSFDPAFDRVQTVWAELDAMMTEGRVVTVHTSLTDYVDMAIEDVDAPRSVETFKSLRFTISFKQIRTVKSEKSTALVPSKPGASSLVSKGKQAAKPAAGPEPQRASALHGILEAAGAF
jgi:hypothetical protein